MFTEMDRHKHTEAWNLFLNPKWWDRMQCVGTGSQDRSLGSCGQHGNQSRAHYAVFFCFSLCSEGPSWVLKLLQRVVLMNQSCLKVVQREVCNIAWYHVYIRKEVMSRVHLQGEQDVRARCSAILQPVALSSKQRRQHPLRMVFMRLGPVERQNRCSGPKKTTSRKFQSTWVHQNVTLGPESLCWHLPQTRKPVSTNSGTKMGQGPLGHQLSCGQTCPILRCLPYGDSYPKVISSPCLTLSLLDRIGHNLLADAGQQEHWRHEQGKMRTPSHTGSDMDHIT